MRTRTEIAPSGPYARRRATGQGQGQGTNGSAPGTRRRATLLAVSSRIVLDDDASPAALTSGGLVVRCGPSEGAWERTVALARAASGPVGVWSDRAPSAVEIALAASAGVRELGLALHGARSEVHDWHAGEGAFDAAFGALTVARAHGIAVAVASAVTRSNARVLIELPSLLKASGVALWALAWPRAEGEAFTAKVPRLGLGVPAALSALERARRIGLDARLVGVPSCVLGPFAPLSLASPARSFGARCEGCAARASCAGVDAAYLTRFGEGELRALVHAVSRAPAPRLADLVAGFA